jgi:AAA ATPase domain
VSLEAFGVKNLRCLTDTGLVPIRPITVLVGRNSSGKSTFLRAFPLLRQSVENARSSPILWRHRDYVNFGTLDLAINDAATQRSVTFEFATEWSDDGYLGQCALRMEIAASTSGPYVRSYELSMDERQARLEFDAEHRLLRIDGKPDEAIRPQDLWLGGVAYLVASLREGGGGRLNYQPYVDDPFTQIANARGSWPGGAEEDVVPLIGRALSWLTTKKSKKDLAARFALSSNAELSALADEVLAWGLALSRLPT